MCTYLTDSSDASQCASSPPSDVTRHERKFLHNAFTEPSLRCICERKRKSFTGKRITFTHTHFHTHFHTRFHTSSHTHFQTHFHTHFHTFPHHTHISTTHRHTPQSLNQKLHTKIQTKSLHCRGLITHSACIVILHSCGLVIALAVYSSNTHTHHNYEPTPHHPTHTHTSNVKYFGALFLRLNQCGGILRFAPKKLPNLFSKLLNYHWNVNSFDVELISNETADPSSRYKIRKCVLCVSCVFGVSSLHFSHFSHFFSFFILILIFIFHSFLVLISRSHFSFSFLVLVFFHEIFER